MDKKFDKSLFIAFEGLDGVGKSTMIDLLKTHIEKHGELPGITKSGYTYDASDVIVVKTPFDHNLLNLIKDPSIEANITELKKRFFVFIVDLMSAYQTIIPALEDGKIVLMDRFFLSNFVYTTLFKNEAFKHQEYKLMESFLNLLSIEPRYLPNLIYLSNTYKNREMFMSKRGTFDELDQFSLNNHDELHGLYLALMRNYRTLTADHHLVSFEFNTENRNLEQSLNLFMEFFGLIRQHRVMEK